MKNSIKKYLKNYIKYVFIFFIGFALAFIELPFYINAPGGLINVSNRIKVVGENTSSGSFNLAYVTEYRATIPNLLIALINPNWDIESYKEALSSNENKEQAHIRSVKMLKESYDNAILVAFKKAEKFYQITNREFYVTYVDTYAKTDLEIGDKILKVMDLPIESKEDITHILSKKKVGDEVSIEVLKEGKIYHKKASIQLVEEKKVIGIVLTEEKEIETNPEITMEFNPSESGPSGGLMLSLTIYNKLIEKDLTKGKTIVGTGTIDENGKVGSIGGVAYKLKGAIKKGAEIFFVPSGENFEEAKKLKEEKNYSITLVPIDTFEQAVDFLENL